MDARRERQRSDKKQRNSPVNRHGNRYGWQPAHHPCIFILPHVRPTPFKRRSHRRDRNRDALDRDQAPVKVLLVAGARPNFPKIAPIAAALRQASDQFSPPVVVHTGQHYDYQLSEIFFEELELGPPQYHLQARSDAGPVRQLADIMDKIDPILSDEAPDLVLVVGDVSSTVACSVAAATRQIPVAHVEAGLRSGDRTMPEEINRVAVDSLADMLFTHCAEADGHLRDEHVPERCIFRIGNVMIDTLHRFLPKAQATDVIQRHGVTAGEYGLVTLHRPSNVDHAETLDGILKALLKISQQIDLVFPVHPRTRQRLDSFGFSSRLAAVPGIRLCEPLGYMDMIALQAAARLVLSDSGGIQEETTALGVPCMTLRPNTERRVTIDEGTNTLVGTDPDRIVSMASQILTNGGKAGRIPELWDGRASERLVDILRAGIVRR